MSIANLFQGLSQGFNTYLALAQAMEEQKQQRLRQGIEDQDRRDRMNLDYQRESREQRAQDYAQKHDRQSAVLQAARDAHIVGLTPDMLDKGRDGNQSQSGAGAGYGGNVLQAGLRSLQIAQSQPGYDPSIQVDLGNGLAFQGPQFGKEQPTHFTPVVGEGNQYLSFDNKSGRFIPSNFQARQPVGSDPNNPRRYVVEHTPNGDFVTDKLHPEAGRQIIDPASGKQAQGSMTLPSNPELAATASYNNLESAFNGLKKNLAAVNYAAPSVGTQFALDESKSTSGPLSSIRRSLANTYVGKNDPQYQAIQNSVDFLGTMVTKMVTGAQMSEPEAQRIMGILRTVAGDTPEVAQQKINNVQQIMDAEKVKAFRASGSLVGNGGTAQPASPRSKKYVLPDGTVVE